MSYRYNPARPAVVPSDPLDMDAPIYAATAPGSRTPHDRHRGHGGGGGGGRKNTETVNLNHLLNFSMPARNGHGSGHGSRHVNGGSAPRRSRGVRAVNGAYLREKYVNAQFRFVMKPTGNYNAHLADPDVFFDWPSILQVIVPTVSALSQAQGDEPSSLLESSAQSSASAVAYEGADPERRLRKEKEREGMSCPICLGRPVAGRMTKCGHIFCYPCILHYFQLSDIPKNAKCPICGDTIQERMLKSVLWWDSDMVPDSTPECSTSARALPPHDSALGHLEHHDHGSDVVGALDLESASAGTSHRLRMRLMLRPHISTLALPRSPTWPSEAVFSNSQAPFHFVPDVMAFSKFCLATPEYIIEQLDRDLAELSREKQDMVASGDELGATFVDAAERMVKEQINKAKEELDVPSVRRMERHARDAIREIERVRGEKAAEEKRRQDVLAAHMTEADAPSTAATNGEVPAMHLAMTGQPAYVNDVASVAAEPATPPPDRKGVPPTPRSRNSRRQNAVPGLASADEPAYLFYQAATGSNIFLHPLDIKILLSHYKSYASFPDTLTIRPEGSDEGTINEELRKRCKYLSHLPLGTDVVFLEADLEDTLGHAAVAPFEQALKQRRNRRREKVRKEDRAKSRWEAKEREKLPYSARAVFNGEGDSEEFLLALERSALEAADGTAFPAVDGSNPSSATNSYLSSTATSFPPSTLVAAASTGISPTLVNAYDSSTSPPTTGVKLDGVWGLAPSARASASNGTPQIVRPVKKTEEDLEMDQVWSAFQQSAASTTQDQATGGKAGGKKTKKKVVLNMSSGGRRA